MSESSRTVAEEREKRKTWIRRVHESHPILAFIFVDLGAMFAVAGALWVLPSVTVRWSTLLGLLAVAVVFWLVVLFERPPRPGPWNR